ncbi:MAG: hypothetical protein R2719_12300 [Micropruina sp.]
MADLLRRGRTRGRGLSLDEIADATRAISRVLDDARSRPWTLEVSSRGVSRPLTEPKHFRRNTGRLIAVTTGEGGTGRITGVTDDAVTLDVTGSSRTLALAEISRVPGAGRTQPQHRRRGRI